MARLVDHVFRRLLKHEDDPSIPEGHALAVELELELSDTRIEGNKLVVVYIHRIVDSVLLELDTEDDGEADAVLHSPRPRR